MKVYNAEYDVEKARQEADILKQLDHPRIIKFLDFKSPQADALGKTDAESSILVMEYASKRNLLKLVYAFGRLPDIVTRSYFHQLIDAVEYLHTKGVAHGDIKPENILVDGTFNLKLADFGSAAKFSKGSLSAYKTETSPYLSPEKHVEESYDPFKADIFALGVVLFIMVSGSLPFESATKEDVLYKLIIEENFEEFWQIQEELWNLRKEFPLPKGLYKASFKELMNQLFCFDPANRYTIDQLKESAYYQENILSNDKLFDFVNQIATKMKY